MSIRVTLCVFVVIALSVDAWRGNWFRSLCGALVLMAFLEHPDMPRSILGVPGFNLWNLLYANIVLAWLKYRGAEGADWDLPQSLRIALVLYFIVLVTAFLRLFFNPTEFHEGTPMQITMNYLINPVKFFLPALVLYDSVRTRDRVIWALSAILLAYFLLSIQVINYMGIRDFSGESLSRRAAKIIARTVGYHRVDMSMMLGGASWAIIAFSTLVDRAKLRWALWGAAGIVLLGQALTGGRTGYVTWGLVGLAFALIKWRKLFLLMPVAVILVVTFMPGVRERMLAGFGAGDEGMDTAEITSGRTVIWPHVIDKIQSSPIFGYGRLAMERTGLESWLASELGEVFGHPHNAYLEILLDNGIVGFLCVMPIYVIVLRRVISLFRDRRDPLYEVAGGVAAALLLALLIGSMGAQTLYPREGVVGMWAVIGVALRVWVEREYMDNGQPSSLDPDWSGSEDDSDIIDVDPLSSSASE